MLKDYDEATAFHYKAFRPALHDQILSECLGEGRFKKGLDVGCGTGQSSIALAPYCVEVIAIEPSKAMLGSAIPHPRVDYRGFNGKSWPLINSEVDVVTFAGSLYYAKSQTLLNEIRRVCRTTATVLIYDFDIMLEAILKAMDFNKLYSALSVYDHRVDLSGLDSSDFDLLHKEQQSAKISLDAKQLAHLILADKRYYLSLIDTLGKNNLYHNVFKMLLKISDKQKFEVPAKLYFTQYAYVKK